MGVYTIEYTLKSGKVVRKRAIRWYVWEGEKNGKKKIFKAKTAILGLASKVSKRTAREVLKAKVKSLEDKNAPAYIKGPLTLGEYTPEFLKNKKVDGKKVWKHYTGYTKPLLRILGPDKHLDKITIQDIKDYKEKRTQEVTAASCNRDLQCLRHILNYAVRSKRLYLPEGNPVLYHELLTELTKPRIVLTPEQWFLLDANLPPPSVFVFRHAILTGMRSGETIQTLESDLRLEAGYIFLGATITKGQDYRQVAIDEDAIDNINEALDFRNSIPGGDRAHVFVNRRGQPYVSHNSVYETFVRYARKLGMPGISPHSLRHTFATWSLNEDGNVRGIQAQLGHKRLETTEIYAKPDQIVQEAQKKVSDYLRRKRLELVPKDSEEDKLIVGF